jgi:hypothetical protein
MCSACWNLAEEKFSGEAETRIADRDAAIGAAIPRTSVENHLPETHIRVSVFCCAREDVLIDQKAGHSLPVHVLFGSLAIACKRISARCALQIAEAVADFQGWLDSRLILLKLLKLMWPIFSSKMDRSSLSSPLLAIC